MKLSSNDGRTIDVEKRKKRKEGKEKRGIHVRSTRVSQQTTYIYEGGRALLCLGREFARGLGEGGGTGRAETASGGISQASGGINGEVLRAPPYDRIRGAA